MKLEQADRRRKWRLNLKDMKHLHFVRGGLIKDLQR